MRHPYDYDDRMWAGLRGLGYEVVLALATGLFITAAWMLTS